MVFPLVDGFQFTALHHRMFLHPLVLSYSHFRASALTTGPLSRLSSSLVSFVYSHDVVSRLYLGSIRDLKNAPMWPCEEESRKMEEKNAQDNAGYAYVTSRAKTCKDGQGRVEVEYWVFYSGTNICVVCDHTQHRSPAESHNPDKLRLRGFRC